MKIYTRSGDDGSTGLFGGSRVSKSDARIECYGTVDELNASLGLAATVAGAELRRLLNEVQNELFVIGSQLATPAAAKQDALPALAEASVSRLEAQIDSAESRLPKIQFFILPGGNETAARLHLARTICRRAERLLVAFAAEHGVAPIIIRYLNRLSDWLFVHARLANHEAGLRDVPWTKPS